MVPVLKLDETTGVVVGPVGGLRNGDD
ncbi:MAG: hypothetical protein J07HX64_01657 [halophilic archaeon J07HX64]|nr:MAG: hypothetical protein J07HX64_01657 [halophilic archaeon J07HX64]